MEPVLRRPRVYTQQEVPLRVVSVRLTLWHERQAKELGNGELSLGIRIALERSAPNSANIPTYYKGKKNV